MSIGTNPEGELGDSPRFQDDLSLTVAAASGDDSARRAIAERLFERIRTTVRYLAGGHRDQDDWVQLALVEILRSCGSFRGRGSLESFANRITVRVAMRQLKKSRRREGRFELDSDPGVRSGADADDAWQRMELRRSLARMIGTLTPPRREVVVLRLVHGHSIDEIAEMTGAPRDTVRNRLRRGRRQLKKKVSLDPVFSDWVRSRSR